MTAPERPAAMTQVTCSESSPIVALAGGDLAVALVAGAGLKILYDVLLPVVPAHPAA